MVDFATHAPLKKWPRTPPGVASKQISYLDAILGNDNVNVEVVDGSVEIKVPQGCQPETVLRIRGKGAPQLNNASVSSAFVLRFFFNVLVCLHFHTSAAAPSRKLQASQPC